MFNIGPLELIVILLVALIVVGPNKLPELGRQIGKGLREFRKAQDEIRDTLRFDLDDPEPTSHTSRRAEEPSEPPTVPSGSSTGDGQLAGPPASEGTQTSSEPEGSYDEPAVDEQSVTDGGITLEEIPDRRTTTTNGEGSEDRSG